MPYAAYGDAGDVMSDSWTLTIPDEATLSNLVEVGAFKIFSLEFPSAMTGASVTFEGGKDSTVADAVALLRQDGTAVTVTKQLSKIVGLTNAEDALVVASVRWLRVRSASTESSGPIVLTLHGNR